MNRLQVVCTISYMQVGLLKAQFPRKGPYAAPML